MNFIFSRKILRLEQRGTKQSIDELITMLDDTDWEIRQAVANALGRVGDADVVAVLEKHVNDSNAAVSTSVSNAINNIKKRQVNIADRNTPIDHSGG